MDLEPSQPNSVPPEPEAEGPKATNEDVEMADA